jgi:hypothetical protein
MIASWRDAISVADGDNCQPQQQGDQNDEVS